MSGPIVRKYGFPNFEKIFGKRELEHGVEDEAKDAQSPESGKPQAEPSSGDEKKKSTPAS